MARVFAADFETTTQADDCRVWAYAICEVGDPDNFIYGNSIDDFMSWCANPKQNFKCLFHNLKFDGEFILNWLFKNGFEFIPDSKMRANRTFTTLVTDMGQFYEITVYFTVDGHHTNKVTFQDSLKILNFSVDKIAKDFDLPIRKLELDYKTAREVGHELTQHEVDYIRNDVEIMARAIDIMYQKNLKKMTIGSDALSSFKDSTDGKFRVWFPTLKNEIDADIRKSYKGGFTYLSDKYTGKEVGAGVVLDVNSLYPSRMKFCPLPIGQPELFDGKYKEDPLFPLYVQRMSCSFSIKHDKIPTIQLKNSRSFLPNEYIKTTHGEIVTLTLTSVDLELFFKHYNVKNITYECGWKFKQMRGAFDNYIDFWMEQKIQATKDKNKSLRAISKLMLNSLYGKFGSSPVGLRKQPVYGSDEKVHYSLLPVEEKPTVYIPAAAFITAWARKLTIETSQFIREWSEEHKGFDAYIYSDTDSIHACLSKEDMEELSKYMEIDDYKLGAWAWESSFTRGKYLRQKCYIEEIDGEINVTVAGMPKKLGHLVTFENFEIGFSTADFTDEEIGAAGRKLAYKHVDGGVVLVDTDFTIK